MMAVFYNVALFFFWLYKSISTEMLQAVKVSRCFEFIFILVFSDFRLNLEVSRAKSSRQTKEKYNI